MCNLVILLIRKNEKAKKPLDVKLNFFKRVIKSSYSAKKVKTPISADQFSNAN
jgi:hypothetical protein